MKKTLLILITGLAFTAFATHSFASEARDVQIHGLVSQGYLYTTENNFISDSTEGSFKFNEMAINFAKSLTNGLYVGLQFFAKDFGDTGNNDIKIDWALADYRFNDWLGLRFGQLKSPHGFYNEYRDIDTLRTFIFLPQSIYPEITRDVQLSIQGGGIYGVIEMDAAGQVTYQALYGTQTIDANSSRLTEALSGVPATFVDNDTTEVDHKYAASLAYDTFFPGLRLGATYNNMEMTFSGSYNREVAGVFPAGTPVTMEFKTYRNWICSAEYTWQNLVLMAEYLDTYREFDNIMGEGDLTYLNRGEFKQTGWYVGATYRLLDWLEFGTYYSVLESNTNSNLGEFSLPDYYDDLTDICATLRFDLNDYLTLKVEYHTFNGAKGLSAWDNQNELPDNPLFDGDFEEEWTMFAAKMTAAF